MNYQIVTQKLKDLGLSWMHPRVAAYMAELSNIHGRRYSPSTLPGTHYDRLTRILEAYERIDYLLIAAPGGWNCKEIIHFFKTRSTKDDFGNPTNRLKLRQWLQLEELATNMFTPF